MFEGERGCAGPGCGPYARVRVARVQVMPRSCSYAPSVYADPHAAVRSMQPAPEPSQGIDQFWVDWPGLPLAGNGSLRLRGEAAGEPLGRHMRDGLDELQGGASTLSQLGSPSGSPVKAAAARKLSRWRCLDSTHHLACTRCATRAALGWRGASGVQDTAPSHSPHLQMHAASSAGPGGGVRPRERRLSGDSPAGCRPSPQRGEAAEVCASLGAAGLSFAPCHP